MALPLSLPVIGARRPPQGIGVCTEINAARVTDDVTET
jgi:hypothetical protein